MFTGINVVIFHPHYWMFDLGCRLNRYEEKNGNYQWIRKELDIGLLVVSVRFNWIFNKRPLPGTTKVPPR